MSEQFIKIVSKELKNCRNDKDYTLEDAYKISKVAPSTISCYENSNRQMTLDIIFKLLEAYQVSPDIFFTRCIAKTQGK